MCTEAPAARAELLEVERQHAHGARNVARELLQPRRFLQIDEDEFVEAEMRREADAHRRLVRRDLVEIARQAMAAPLRVAHHLARLEQRPQLVVEIEGVDDLDRLRSTHSYVIPASVLKMSRETSATAVPRAVVRPRTA